MMSNMDLTKLTSEELYSKYIEFTNKASQDLRTDLNIKYAAQAGIYLTEINRRANNKANRVMRKWTIAIGVMTAVMLVATILNVIISCGG